ncbi:MAG TPA: hypothetical protein VGN20_24420 [Mucilaginibacter sp.]|jgi:hypothetical protein
MKTSTDNTAILLKAIDLKLKMLLQQDLAQFKLNRENKQGHITKAA